MSDISVREISTMLSRQAESVCRLLLSGGSPAGDEWECADTNGGKGKSLKVKLSGE